MARVLDVQPVGARMERLVGTVGELWRYPVKSMLGSRVPEVLVTERGCLGDRAWALRDLVTGRIASAKRIPRMLEFRATYESEPTTEVRGRARIETPDGRSISVGDPAASRIISELKVVTEVSEAVPFWEAEPEHQDYLQRYPGGYSCHYPRPGWKLPHHAAAA